MVGYSSEDKNHLSEFWQGLAGVCSGVVTRFCFQPLDVLKIRFQLQHEPIKKSPHSYYWNMVQASSRIFREEKLRAMWKGHVPAQFLSGVYGMAQFASFEFLTKTVFMHNETLEKKYKAETHFLCGSISGALATIVSMPFDTLRTRLVGQGEPKLYTGLTDACVKMVRHEGVLSFYKGLLPTLIQIMPHTGLTFACYQILSQACHTVLGTDSNKKLSPGWNALCGCGAGVVAKTAVYPLDLVKKRIQIQGFEEARHRFGKTYKVSGIKTSISVILKNEGITGFYKGLKPSVVKAMATTGMTFMLFEEFFALFVKFNF